MKKIISIAKDFSKFPGGRNLTDGEFSGERFRDEIVIPALNAYEQVEIDLDGTMGYGSSFLEEAFGGLIRKGFSRQDIERKIIFSSSRSGFIEEINHHIDFEDAK